MVALIGAGYSDEPDENGSAANANTGQEQAVKFAECIRDNGVSEFPDPDASGRLTIDAVVNGSSLDPSTPAWKTAIGACEDLQRPGFTGDEEVTAEEQETRLEFAQCMRENGVKDFPAFRTWWAAHNVRYHQTGLSGCTTPWSVTSRSATKSWG
jgi:hypothetical protein